MSLRDRSHRRSRRKASFKASSRLRMTLSVNQGKIRDIMKDISEEVMTAFESGEIDQRMLDDFNPLFSTLIQAGSWMKKMRGRL